MIALPNGTLIIVSFSPGLVLSPELATSNECNTEREELKPWPLRVGKKGRSLLSPGLLEIPIAAVLCPPSPLPSFIVIL